MNNESSADRVDTSHTITTTASSALFRPSTTLPVTDDYAGVLLSERPMLDLRAPVEFARGSFPNSTNLPLLTDQERHEVGLCYRRHGQDAAIALGARLVSGEVRQQRLAAWVSFAEEHPDALIYCFRGGMRSAIVQQWLNEAGITLPRIKGGYKALRWHLISEIETTAPKRISQQTAPSTGNLPGIILGGRTGSGKTVLLNQLTVAIDLEALAEHRGSSFGATALAQPSNIDFEHRLAIALLQYRQAASRYDPVSQPPLYLEDEGRMVGRVCVPQTFRNYMLSLPCVLLETPLEERIAISRDAYVTELLALHNTASKLSAGQGDVSVESHRGFAAFADYHRAALGRIRKRLGGVQYQLALSQLEQALHHHRDHNDISYYDAFIELLLVKYYDPMYDYQLSTKNRQTLFKGSASDILEWSQSIDVAALNRLTK